MISKLHVLSGNKGRGILTVLLFLCPFSREIGRKRGLDDHKCAQVVVEQKYPFGKADTDSFSLLELQEPGSAQVPRHSKAPLVFSLPLPELPLGPCFKGDHLNPTGSVNMTWLLPGKRQVLGCIPLAAPSPEDAPGLFSFHGSAFLPQ